MVSSPVLIVFFPGSFTIVLLASPHLLPVNTERMNLAPASSA
jgi:hypothetical protein